MTSTDETTTQEILSLYVARYMQRFVQRELIALLSHASEDELPEALRKLFAAAVAQICDGGDLFDGDEAGWLDFIGAEMVFCVPSTVNARSGLLPVMGAVLGNVDWQQVAELVQ